MFQNIQGQADFEQEKTTNKQEKIKRFLKVALTPQKILIYIACFMLSSIQCVGGIAPFAIAILGASLANRIPILMVYVCTLLGTFVGLGANSALIYLLTSLVFIVMTLIWKPKEGLEYENEKCKLGKYVILSSFLIQISKMLFGDFLVYDLIVSIGIAIASYIFYKIFANSLIVMDQFGKKRAFAIEEVIGASIMLAICASSFRDFAIFGFELRTILSILVVLVLGWKNGVLVGATTGITIGTILGLIGQDEPIIIASYALSGMIAGVFSRFGKFGVIVGFILGNAILTYVTNGNTGAIIYFKEILIASLGLLLVPASIQIDIEELFGKSKLLQAGSMGNLQENRDTIYRLNNVSKTIADIADTYKEAAATTIIEEEEVERKENEKIFTEQLLENIDECRDNILYDDMQNIEQSEMIGDIFKILVENQKITKEDLLNVLEHHNNYVMGFDDEEISKSLEKDLKQIVTVMNEAYRVSKVNFIWKHKIEENKKTMINQLDGVSKVISALADNMEQSEEQANEFIIEKEEILNFAKNRNVDIKDLKIRREKTGRYIINVYVDTCCEENEKRGCTVEILEKILSKVLEEKIVLQKNNCGQKKDTNLCINTYTSQDKYTLQLGISRKTKQGSPISGDTSTSLKLEDGKYLLAISDGMGTGPKARQSSKIAIKMLERLLTDGFDKDSSIELINTTLSASAGEDDTYATLDIAILDLYAGNIEFIKNGACPSYIKQNGKVQIIKALSLPAGILDNISLVVYDKDIEDNDILVMCSDGIMESNTEYQNKELWVRDILESIGSDNVQKIADIVTKEAIDNGYGQVKDDMTIIVAKMIKK